MRNGRRTRRVERKRQTSKDRKHIVVIWDRATARLAVSSHEGLSWEVHCSKAGRRWGWNNLAFTTGHRNVHRMGVSLWHTNITQLLQIKKTNIMSENILPFHVNLWPRYSHWVQTKPYPISVPQAPTWLHSTLLPSSLFLLYWPKCHLTTQGRCLPGTFQ